jgi:glycosyltransferase involved in cell wall biosynthesis
MLRGVERGEGPHEPLVSVILAVRNREGCVARAITSVLAQTYRALELIVVDDASVDGTRRVVESFGESVTLIAQAHAGVYAARNLGIRHARGELIAFIDSDDAWVPDKLAAQLPLMRRPEVGLVFGDTVHVTAPRSDAPRTGLTSFRVAPPARGRAAERFAWCNFVPTCTVLVRRTCLEEIGGFSEASALSADYLAWFRIALRHELDYVDRPVAEYTIHADGVSFDLGRSLAARLDLFSSELALTTAPAAQAVLRRLVFNLSLHMVFAVLRGRARTVANPLRLAWRTVSGTAGPKAPRWTAAFAANQVRLRARRLFS